MRDTQGKAKRHGKQSLVLLKDIHVVDQHFSICYIFRTCCDILTVASLLDMFRIMSDSCDHTPKQKLQYLSSTLDTIASSCEVEMNQIQHGLPEGYSKKVSHHPRCQVPASQAIRGQASLVTLKSAHLRP